MSDHFIDDAELDALNTFEEKERDRGDAGPYRLLLASRELFDRSSFHHRHRNELYDIYEI